MSAEEKQVLKAITAYIPQLIVEERLLNPHLPDVHGQFRQGTLVFADISGFTTMSEKLSKSGKEGAEELNGVLNQYFAHMLGIIRPLGGTQLKFGGDSMFLLFVGQQHADRAVHCAMQMQKAMEDFDRVSTSQGIFRLEMSIGINSGEFFAASVGSPRDRLYHIVTGREVNRTAEIEAVAAAGEILISTGSLHELGDNVEVDQERDGCHRVRRLCTCLKSIEPCEPNLEEGVSEFAIEVLASYLPSRLVERLRDNPDRAGVEGEHRRVTMMFVNLLGMTEAIDKCGAGQETTLTQLLNDYFLTVHAMVKRYEGVLVGCDINTTGDKLLIIFGSPVAHEDDDERAVLCAQEMAQLVAGSSLPFELRIGINSGHVFAGELGSPLRKEYTVMGDEVNVAARLMSIAHEGQILVGHSTYQSLAGKFVLQTQEPVRVKGKSQPVAAYLVKEGLQESIPHQELEPGELVGREEETAMLEEVVKLTLSGQGQVLAITGAAGIGKSRLVEELKLLWSREDGVTYIGNCQSRGVSTSYLPWIELLGSVFDLQEGDSSEQRRDKIETTFDRLCPELAEWKAVIGNLLHVPIPESTLLQFLNPKMRRQRLMDVTLRLLRALTEEARVLLLFEDLHWADSASAELLDYVARNTRDCPLLVCAVHRPEGQLELEVERQDNYTNIALGELLPESSLALVRSMTKMKELPQELSQLVLTKAQGNPFFVEEIVRSLLDSEYLRLDTSTGEYQPAVGLRQVEMPDTIKGVIVARLDQLEEGTRNVLRIASVIGRFFQYAVLRAIYPRDIADDELLQRLSDLARLGLTRLERKDPVPEYYFKHILTQEVAYESLGFAQRRDLHDQVASYLEETYPNELEPLCEVLFHHYSHSRDNLKIRVYAYKAAEKARQAFAFEEAIEYYRSGLDAVQEDDGQAACLRSYFSERIGDCYEMSGRHEEAERTFLQVLQQWRETIRQLSPIPERIPLDRTEEVPTKGREAILCHKIAVSCERNSDYDSSLQWLESAAEVLPPKQPSLAGKIHITRGVALFRKGLYEEAIHWGQQGLDLSRRSGDKSQLAYAHNMLAGSYLDMGNLEQAIRHRRQSLSLCEEAGDLYGLATANNNLGTCYQLLGDLDKALYHYKACLKDSERIGNSTVVAIVHNNIGEVLLTQGHIEQAIEHLQTLTETCERTGDLAAATGLALINLSRCYQRQQLFDRALECLEQGVNLLREVGARGLLIEARLQNAELHLETGEIDSASRICHQALRQTREVGARLLESRGLCILGRIRMSRGQYRQAETDLRQSAALAQQLNADYERGRALLYLAELYGNRIEEKGNQHQCQLALRQAEAIFQRMGAQGELAQALRLHKDLEL